MITAHTGETRSGAACVELRDGDKVVLKAYGNEAGDKIRVVLIELHGYGQVLISPENRMLEFTRKA